MVVGKRMDTVAINSSSSKGIADTHSCVHKSHQVHIHKVHSLVQAELLSKYYPRIGQAKNKFTLFIEVGQFLY